MYYLYKIGLFISLTLPLRITYAIATGLAFLYYLMAPNDRRALGDNIRIVLKGKATAGRVRAYTRRTFINFAKYLVDFLRFSVIYRDYIRKNVTIRGLENIDEARKQEKGVVILSSH
ncbi:MAG: hypothetical protein PHS37_08315, partial [Candidatus Omnitrophica bacterium]|nr:hypothetical protein [Candidatus Omnitrophota bacterium]